MKKYFYDSLKLNSTNFLDLIKLIKREKTSEELVEVDKNKFLSLKDYEKILREPKGSKGKGLPSSFNTYIRKNEEDVTIGLIFEFSSGKCFISYVEPKIEERLNCYVFTLNRGGFSCSDPIRAKIMLDLRLDELGYVFDFKGGL